MGASIQAFNSYQVWLWLLQQYSEKQSKLFILHC